MASQEVRQGHGRSGTQQEGMTGRVASVGRAAEREHPGTRASQMGNSWGRCYESDEHCKVDGTAKSVRTGRMRRSSKEGCVNGMSYEGEFEDPWQIERLGEHSPFAGPVSARMEEEGYHTVEIPGTLKRGPQVTSPG